ncbi:hypothetical protein JL857_20720 [Vibrio parahaemolyticus]|uniref:Uncharacterized protein n=2 Tax=Vibrio parahaemolyticus TaxID=670 RepID=A0A9Q3UEZ6_VIBPH|nr:hypothetical protein [Vibrio parahaemolyticus]MCI9696471.1 hypothetical protein [Vibrio parahaemolyticus]MCI9711065.1 hypothetical protein [Vibrio parahaemolyticus]MCI9715945.1 hypothetical protein [Vibrio parahaemolyticus]
MKKWIVLGLATLCSFSTLAFDELFNSKSNPASMRYYVEHYQNINSQEYKYLLVSVRAAADAINFYTTRLDERNQRIDYCLPMKNPASREALWDWNTKDLMALINNHIEHDPNFKKYGKVGITGPIGSYLAIALKEQYPCPVQKQW